MEAQGLDSPTAILKVAERLAIVDSHRLDHYLPHLKDPLPPFPAPFDYHNHIGSGSRKNRQNTLQFSPPLCTTFSD